MSMSDLPSAIGPTAEETRLKLVELIANGSLSAGQRLGSERALAATLGVSRSTLRQALAVLEDSDAVRRIPGRGGGTFVSAQKIERDLSRIVGVPAYLRDQGITAGSRVISAAVLAADDETAAALGLASDALVYDIVRIRLADGAPISLERARFPADRFPGLLELPLGGSVYELLEQEYSVTPHEALERIEVVPAGADEGSILGVPAGAPLLSVTRTTEDAAGARIEFSHDLFRADRTRIVVRTPGRAGVTGSARTRGNIIELRASSR
ncbi:MAG: GntR family transcriptional regulator [Actinomycetes bacterium]